MKLFSKTLYHGTPNNFDKFDLNHIGSGEGEQVHGWGLYFAEDKQIVLDNYSDLNQIDDTYKVLSLDNEEYPLDSKSRHMSDISNWFYTHGLTEYDASKVITEYVTSTKCNATKSVYKKINESIRAAEIVLERDVKPYLKEAYSEYLERDNYLLKFLKEHDFKMWIHKPENFIFEIEIPDNLIIVEEKAIFYDKEYNQNIKEIISKAWNYLFENKDLPFTLEELLNGFTFNSIRFQMENFSSPKEVSLAFEKFGLNGIHYIGERDGSCYVIFNPENINIIKKEQI